MLRKFICILTILIMVMTATMAVYADNGTNVTPASLQKSGDDKSAKNDPGKDTTTKDTTAKDTTSKDVSSKDDSSKDGTPTDKSDADTAAAEKIQADCQNIIDDVLVNGSENGADLIKITSPDKDSDVTVKKTYVLSGITKYTDVKIYIARYNSDSKKYDEEILDTDNESSWVVGEGGVFSKEAVLKQGANKIKIIAVRTSMLDGDFTADDIQVDTFSISYIRESVISKAITAITNTITGLTKPSDDKAKDPKKK